MKSKIQKHWEMPLFIKCPHDPENKQARNKQTKMQNNRRDLDYY